MYFQQFTDAEIEQQVLAKMRELDIEPYDEHIIIDGGLHRYRTKDDRPSETSGAYCIHPDGIPAGFFQDWRTGAKENWRFDTGDCPQDKLDYFKSKEFAEKAKQASIEREKERKEKQARAAEHSRQIWEQLIPAPGDHPYLKKKQIYNYGFKLRKSDNWLAVPLRDIDGVLKSIQWIAPDGMKRFQLEAPNDDVFYSIALDILKSNPDQIILIGEGVATMCKVYELTGYPCVAAKNCSSLPKICKIIREKYPKNKIIITADDDKATELKRGDNPGIKAAKEVCDKKLANGYVTPPFKSPDDGTDWDDFALEYGDDTTTTLLYEKIKWACLTENEKKEFLIREKLSAAVHFLDPSINLPPQEFIGGLFPRKFVSLLVAPPGTGKTIFMQKSVSDLSIGGSFFDGFVDDEPARKCLIFAGEAGYELLVRRGASLKWAINPKNVIVVDQYEFETNDLDVMLDSEDGWANVVRLIDMYKPDIVFFDTFMSFHEGDEIKGTEMKPILKKLARLARSTDIAMVLVHHSRKRAAKERTLSLNQDDVVGTGVFNRLVGLIVGIEPMKEDEKTLLVRSLKSWFSTFMPFTYRLSEDSYGHTVIQTDLAPETVGNPKIAVWNYLQKTFNPDEWFSLASVVLSEIGTPVTTRQLRRIFSDFVKNNKLKKQGSTKDTEYSLVGFYG